MLKFVIYTRVSTAQQTEGTSLESQETACRALVDQHGGTVVAVLSEAVSGSLYLARSELQRAICMVESGEADGVAMLDMERFARHAAYQEIAFDRITRAGGTVIFCRDQFENSPEGRLARGVRGHVTQYYREKQRILSMEGHLKRAVQGLTPQRNRPPLGYRIIKKADVIQGHPGPAGSFEIIESEAAVVLLIFLMRDAGESMNGIAHCLTEEGIPGKYGGRWTAQTVRTILRNPVHKGCAAFGRTTVVTDESRLARGVSHLHRTPKPHEEWITIPTPAIVSEELWERCQGQKKSYTPELGTG